MKTPLAWLNLAHSKMRTTAAVAGVTFAVVLIFMQLGFLGSVRATASLVYDALDFDLLLRSPRYVRLSEARTFPRDRLYQAASVPGVQRASAFYVGQNQWRNPRTGRKRRILTMGVKPGEQVFTVEEIEQKASLLTAPEFVLVDRKSRPEFGPRDNRRFGDGDIGSEAEVALQRVRIVEHFSLGGGLEADGAILLGERGFRRIHPERAAGQVSLGLIKLAAGGGVSDGDPVRTSAAAARLRGALPGDVDVLTRQQVMERELQLWLREMSIGVIFQIGVAVALVVGTAIVYQVLSSDVTNHLPEYATLKAMGYRNGFLAKVVLEQAVTLAVLGFLPGLALAEVLYRLTNRATELPIEMNLPRIGFVLGMSVAMCTLSGLGALGKVRRADPADLF